VSPHAFASDGLRWHTRAYCHIDQKFKDFILSRCLDCRNLGEAGASPAPDELWNSYFQVVLIPNPKLTKSRQDVIAQDFAMVSGRVNVPVRHAMLYYFSKRLRLDLPSADARETPVVVANREEFDSALSEAMR
jgi:predicted DNA-binding transcriptional regulator YafY